MATDSLQIKTMEQIRDDILRVISNELINIGIDEPDVSPGTDHYNWAVAVASVVHSAMSNTVVMGDQLMPDTATGENLLRQTRLYDIDLRPPGGSNGNLWLTSSVSPIGIATGLQLQDPFSAKYRVTLGGLYSNGDLVPIESLSSGSSTNIAAYTTLKWVSPPAYVNSLALVASGGMTGGVDQEDPETLRSRFFEFLRNPPAGGNWAQAVSYAENASTQVQKAFAYPCFNGPGTQLIVVVRAPTSTNKNREVSGSVVTNTISPLVTGKLAEYAEHTVTSVQNQTIDLSMYLSIPAAKSAVPAGPGGGWIDGTPWPTPSNNSSATGANSYSAIFNVTSSLNFSVTALNAPVIGNSLCWLSPLDWKLYRAKVLSYTQLTPYSYNIVVDTPFVNISTACSLPVVAGRTTPMAFPDALNMSTYAASILNAFSTLGPGQITTLAGLLPRAYRHPYTNESWPSDINSTFYNTFEKNVGDEVVGISTLSGSQTTPSIPTTTVMSGSNILTPNNLAFYPL